jgi:hypothetical protein
VPLPSIAGLWPQIARYKIFEEEKTEATEWIIYYKKCPVTKRNLIRCKYAAYEVTKDVFCRLMKS